MKRKFNYVWLAVTLALALVLLFGGQWIWRQQGVEKPLRENLLALTNVEAVSFEETSGGSRVRLELREAGNIYRDHQAAAAVLQEHGGRRSYEIEFVDQPNARLLELEEELQPLLYQALAQDEYVGLRESLSASAQLVACEARLYIDGERLYLQLVDGEHYLYRLMPRE